MQDRVTNSENSGLEQYHIQETGKTFLKDDRSTESESGSNGFPNSHNTPSNRNYETLQPEVIWGASLNKDCLANARRQYLLPHPGNNNNRPMGVNLDCCCQDFELGKDRYLDALSYQSSPSETYRQRWTREDTYSQELF